MDRNNDSVRSSVHDGYSKLVLNCFGIVRFEEMGNEMKVAIAQIAPVVLNREATLEKVKQSIHQAADQDCRLIAFGETLVPAYPFWLCRTDAAKFDDSVQKGIHAKYLNEAVKIPSPEYPLGHHDDHLREIRQAAKERGISVVMGVAERAVDRGGHTIYCSRVFVSGEGESKGEILSVHRKLMPTYEERLSWGIGDGAGLVTHSVGDFSVGGLNCWENWLPLARATLYAAGETLHVMLWPGCQRLTEDITRFVAKEGRLFVISASGLIRNEDIPADVPHRELMLDQEGIYDGGSCIAGPDGNWIVEPVLERESLIVADLDANRVLEERQNMDPSGHYSRPDVFQLKVNKTRQQIVVDWNKTE